MNSTINPGSASPLPNRLSYPDDDIRVVRPTFKYEGTTRTLEESPLLKREIDGAVVFTSCIDGQTRQAALEAFEAAKAQAALVKEKNESLATRNIIEIGSGVAVTALSIPGAIVAAAALPAIVAGLAGAAAVAGIALTVDGIRRYCNSSTQVENAEGEIRHLQSSQRDWHDPITGLIEKRRLAGQKGFDFVWKMNLKGSIVHQEEVKHMWVGSFRSLVSNPVDIDSAYRGNLLGESAMDYAYGNSPIPFIETSAGDYPKVLLNTVVQNYRNWRQAYKMASEQKDAALHSVRSQKIQAENELSALRTKWLLPAIRTHQLGKENAEQHYRNSLRIFQEERDRAIVNARRHYAYVITDPLDGDEVAYKISLDKALDNAIRSIHLNYKNHPEIREIKAAYHYDIRMHDFMFQQSKEMVNAHFDNKVRMLRSAADIAEGQILSQYNAIREQLKDLLYKALHPQSLAPLGRSDFSFAPFNIHTSFDHFVEEPSWRQVYGAHPAYRSDFASHIAMDDWDLFWSDRGIGSFASRPFSRWESMPREQIFVRRYPVRRAPATEVFFRPAPVLPYVRNQAPRVVPGTHTSTGFGGTVRREGHIPAHAPHPVHVPPVVNDLPRVVPGTGTHTTTAFGGTVRREEPVHAPAPQPVRVPVVERPVPNVVPGNRAAPDAGFMSHRVRQAPPAPAPQPVRQVPPAPAPRPVREAPARPAQPSQPAPQAPENRTLPGNRSAANAGTRRR